MDFFNKKNIETTCICSFCHFEYKDTQNTCSKPSIDIAKTVVLPVNVNKLKLKKYVKIPAKIITISIILYKATYF